MDDETITLSGIVCIIDSSPVEFICCSGISRTESLYISSDEGSGYYCILSILSDLTIDDLH